MTENQRGKQGGYQRPQRWAYCPECYRERRYTKLGVMVPHRKYIRHITAEFPYGYMDHCDGTGQKPIPVRMERSLIH